MISSPEFTATRQSPHEHSRSCARTQLAAAGDGLVAICVHSSDFTYGRETEDVHRRVSGFCFGSFAVSRTWAARRLHLLVAI